MFDHAAAPWLELRMPSDDDDELACLAAGPPTYKCFNGAICDAKLFSSALTSAQVSALYAAGVPSKWLGSVCSLPTYLLLLLMHLNYLLQIIHLSLLVDALCFDPPVSTHPYTMTAVLSFAQQRSLRSCCWFEPACMYSR
jgi:hypothetical protein